MKQNPMFRISWIAITSRPLKIILISALVVLFAFPFCAFLMFTSIDEFVSFLSFPFRAFSAHLLDFSQTKTNGSIAAQICYCSLCLTPAFYLAVRMSKKSARVEDALLAVLSAVLIMVFYFIINDDMIAHSLGFLNVESLDVLKAFLVMFVYSIASAYLILRVSRDFSRDKTRAAQKYGMILWGIFFLWSLARIFGSGTPSYYFGPRSMHY